MLKQLRFFITLLFSVATINILSAAIGVGKGNIHPVNHAHSDVYPSKTAVTATTAAAYEQQWGKKLSFWEKIKFKLGAQYAQKFETTTGSGGKMLSLLAMLLGLGSFVTLWIIYLLGLLMALAAIILGIIALKKGNSKAMAILGILFGTLTLLVVSFFILLLASNFSFV